MAGAQGGITRSGTPGNFTYATIADREDHPVAFVSFFDSLRFANWLHNGQDNGDTETGAYTLLTTSGIPAVRPSNSESITRNPGADFFLTSEDEWYKAAYYDPTTGSYFDYATGSDIQPTVEPHPGGTNSANSNRAVVFEPGFVSTTPVGAYLNSPSPYGTFDQSGNLWEWNETLLAVDLVSRRGGGWLGSFTGLPSRIRGGTSPILDTNVQGFRIASRVMEIPPPPQPRSNGAVPEPVTGVLSLMGLAALSLVVPRRCLFQL